MNKKLASLLFIAALFIVFCALWFPLRGSFWVSSPQKKFELAWRNDVELLQNSRMLPKQWDQIREIRLSSDNSPVQGWLSQVKPPIHTDPNGRFRLDIYFLHWIEGYRYGVIVNYRLEDLANKNNTVWEQARTFRLGLVY